MNEPSSGNLAPEPFLRTFRTLVETYNVVMLTAAREIGRIGLTVPQYDVLVTLGDTPGMNSKELTDATLIAKGTLTGVLDRLEAKGLINRTRGATDGRQIFVALTGPGDEFFRRVFQPHVDYMSRFFDPMPHHRQAMLSDLLRELSSGFPPS